MMPKVAMVLAAGEGRRLRPLTETRPKPLVAVNGRAIIDHILDRLAEAGVSRVLVNACYRREMIAAHLAGRRGVEVVLEDSPLDTGGSVAAVLGRLGEDPFFVINGDSLWLNGRRAALARLAEAFDPARMDGMLLLSTARSAVGFPDPGDFMLDPDGRVQRRREHQVVPFAYMGVQIASPALFAGAPAGAFSTNLLWDRAIAGERLFGLIHEGLWYHISTPADLAAAERRFAGWHLPPTPYF